MYVRPLSPSAARSRSMSRATSTDPTWGSTFALACSHAAANCFRPARIDGILAGRRRHRVRQRRRRAPRFLPAGHRIAALHAPRVEQHDVEVVEQLRCEHAELVGHVVDAGYSRASRVDDERPDPCRGDLRRVPRHRDRDRRPPWVRVVERHHQRGALEPAVARRPREGRRRRCGRKRGRRGRRARRRPVVRGGTPGLDGPGERRARGREQRCRGHGGQEYPSRRRQPPDHRDHSDTN